MSKFEHKEGTGTVFKNEKYTEGGNHPYAKGSGKTLEGKDIEIALWVPKSDKIKGFNLTFQEPYKKQDSKEEDLPF